jgi:hypothetical protein
MEVDRLAYTIGYAPKGRRRTSTVERATAREALKLASDLLASDEEIRFIRAHAPGEPQDTLTAAIMVAGEVAATEARRRGKTYLVASAPELGPKSMSSPAIIPMPARSASTSCSSSPLPAGASSGSPRGIK